MKRNSEIIWANVIGSNFMMIRLNNEQLVTEHIPLIIWTSLRSPSVLPDGFTGPSLRGVALPVMDRRLCIFSYLCWSSISSWTEWRLQVHYFHILHINDLQYLTVYCLLSTKTTWSVSVHNNPLPVCDSCSFSSTTRLSNDPTVFTGMFEKSHSVVDSCNKTAVSEDNSRDVTHSLPKLQRLSSHFQTLFVDCVWNVMA